MNLTAVLLTGLFAGGISCAAVQGGLLTGLIVRQRGSTENGDNVGGQQVSLLRSFGDDVAPVAGFLAGKLAAHAVLGALLGAAGSVVQVSVGARSWLQIGAGVLIIAFGLAQLGVPGFRRIVVDAPPSWARFVRGRARSRSALAPAALGLATVLIPCGVTLSVEALALASGTPIEGAAIMAVFVIGTSPLFAIIGYAARKLASVWNRRLALATGLAVLVMGALTLNGGLELAGSSLSASRIGSAVGWGTSAASDISTVTVTGGRQEVTITADSGGYRPANVQIQSGLPTTLVLRSAGATGCIRSFVIASRGEERVLPETGDTRIVLGSLQPGRLDYSCGMGMYRGTITIEQPHQPPPSPGGAVPSQHR